MAQRPPLRLSHFGMFVRDLDKMSAFYQEVLGFVETDRGDTRGHIVSFLTRDPHCHHQVVLESGRPETSGRTHAVQQLSFMVDSLDNLRAMYEVVSKRTDVTAIQQVDHGNAWSLYFRDPEENRIEMYLDTPWHVAQPHRVDLDLSKSDEEILAATTARVREDPTCRPMAEWQREVAERLRQGGVPVS